MMTYKQYIETKKKLYVGKTVRYKGILHIVVDVDYNGMLLIDMPSQFNSTTAVDPFSGDIEYVD